MKGLFWVNIDSTSISFLQHTFAVEQPQPANCALRQLPQAKRMLRHTAGRFDV